MVNQSGQIFIGLVLTIVGAIVGAFANAIVNLLLAGKLSSDNFWIWVVIGAIIALLLFWLWQNSMGHREIMYGYRVAIRTYDGNYVTADLNQGHQLFGRAKHVKAWQIFEIVDASRPYSQEANRKVHYGDRIGLKALNNGRFVGADLNSDKQLTTWATKIQGWEIFTLCLTPESSADNKEKAIRYKDTFALEAYNDAFVSYILTGDGRLLATASRIQKWEILAFIDPARP